MDAPPLTPSLLVAMPGLQDPYFGKAVVLLLEYDKEHAFGMIINRPSSVQVKDIVVEGEAYIKDLNQIMLTGGPVQPEFLWALHSSDYRGESTTDLSDNLRLSAVSEALAVLGTGSGPEQCHLGFGYSGWGPGQLEQELQDGTWWPAPLNEGVVLETPYEERWETVLRDLGINPFGAGFTPSGEA